MTELNQSFESKPKQQLSKLNRNQYELRTKPYKITTFLFNLDLSINPKDNNVGIPQRSFYKTLRFKTEYATQI